MRKIIVPGIALIGVAYAFARFSFGLFLPNIAYSLNLTKSNAGVAGSAGYIAYSFALLTSSYLIRRYGQFRVIQFSGLSAVIGLLGIAVPQDFFFLICSTFIAGLGSGWASPALSQTATAFLNEKQQDAGNTWINSGTSFGLILSGPVALLLTAHWRFAFIVFAAIALVVFIWTSVCIPSTNLELRKEKLFKLSTLHKAKFLCISALMIGFGSSIYWTFARSFLKAEYNMSDQESVLFWIIMGISGVIGGFAGRMIVKSGLSFSYRLTVFVMVLSIFMLTIPTLVSIYTSAVLFGIAYISITGLFIVWGTRVFTFMPSVETSLSFFALGIGQSIGSAVAGKLISITSYPFSFILFALVCFGSLFIPMKRNIT